MFKQIPRAVRAATATALLCAGLTVAHAAAPQTLNDLIRAGQRDAVLAAITSPDIDVNAADPDGSTPLLWATYKVDHELVAALLKKGARAKVTNNFGSSPLTEAVRLGDVDLVRMLLAAGADPDSPNQDGQTALMLAANMGSLPIAQMLVDKGAHVNAVENFRGQNALMWAAAENHPDIVDLLLKHHADVRPRAKYDDWPRQMTSEPRAQFRQTGGLTALLYATRSGCYRCAVAIVKAGADVNRPNPDGITPLINAIDNRDYDIAMFLLDKGANPAPWDMNGRTPLYVAVDMHSFRPRGFAAGNFQGMNDRLPSRAENKATDLDVLNRLLALKVDVNHQLTRMRPNGNGRGRFEDYMMRGGTTPLMIAVLAYDAEAVKILLDHGAEVDTPNVYQITPLMAAAGMDGTNRRVFFNPGGGAPGSAPGGKAEDGQARVIEVINLLLDGGAQVNARVTDSHTHTAKMDSYVQGRDHEGQTALFAAADAGWNRVVKHLLDHGADPAAHDGDGKLALDYARKPAPIGPRPVAETAQVKADRDATIALLTQVSPATSTTSTASTTASATVPAKAP